MALNKLKTAEPPSPAVNKSTAIKGVILMLISGFGFTCSVLIASLAAKKGIDINTSNAVRYFLATVLLWIWHKYGHMPVKINSSERYIALGLGVPVFLMGAGYLGATQYIPVSLAVLIFYTGPLLIIIISRFTENEPITVLRLIVICTALLGLMLALEVGSTGPLPMIGILLAFTGAIGMALFVTVSSLTIRAASPQAVNLHSLVGGTLLFCLFRIFMGGPPVAIAQNGVLLLIGSAFFIVVGSITFFAGLKRVGPVVASILMNAEPVITIALATALLGERLSLAQLAGAGLVISAIILITGFPDRTQKRSCS